MRGEAGRGAEAEAATFGDSAGGEVVMGAVGWGLGKDISFWLLFKTYCHQSLLFNFAYPYQSVRAGGYE